MGAVLRVQLRRLDGILSDLRRVRTRAESELQDVGTLRVAPNHDASGDCGVVLALQFASEAHARAFAKEAGGDLPIDTPRHVYSNWTPILEGRIGHHPEMNALRHEKNRGLRTTYKKDMCPRTLVILSRTVLIELSPNWSSRAVRQRVERWKKVAASLDDEGSPLHRRRPVNPESPSPGRPIPVEVPK
jgi:hypothetical protein